MDRIIWEAWKVAKGEEKRRLAAWLLDDDQRIIHGCVRACLPRKTAEDTYRQFYMDAFQAACVGYLIALSRWRPEQGSFDGTAWMDMRHQIREFKQKSAAIRVPRGGADLTVRKQREIEAFYAQHGRQPEPEEVDVNPLALRKAASATMTFVPADEARDADEFTDTGEMVDRKRDHSYLEAYLMKLTPEESAGLFAGRRPDLQEKARGYIEQRRSTCTVRGGAARAQVQRPQGNRNAGRLSRRVA